MTRNDLNEILETCLEEMEAGRPGDEIVARYPNQASELRALLKTAQSVIPKNDSQRVPASAQMDSRMRFLEKAQQYHQQPHAVLPWAVLRFFRSNLGSIAFSAAAILLLFVALGSLKALPGDSLYAVKQAAEQASINLAGNPAARQDRETLVDERRVEDVKLMIQMKRTGTVRFGGYLVHPKDSPWEAAGIALELSPGQAAPAQTLSGAYVDVQGFLGETGRVKVDTLEPRLETVSGTLTSLEPGGWKVSDRFVRINANTTIQGTPQVGRQVDIQAAPLLDSTEMLGIHAEVAGVSQPFAGQTGTPIHELTVTPTFTETPAPTQTETATPTSKVTETPGKNENSAHPQEQPTASPGDSNSGSGSGTHESGSGSGDHTDGGSHE